LESGDATEMKNSSRVCDVQATLDYGCQSRGMP